MNPRLVTAVCILVTLDCALMGYRLAMGRSSAIDKRRHYRRATVRAGLIGQIPIFAVTLLALFFAHHGGVATTTAFNEAMRRFVLVGGIYAGLILAAAALCALPSVTLRTAASVVIFGPFTLLRPVVVVTTIAYAVGLRPAEPVALIALLVLIPGVAIEPMLDRRIAHGLVQTAG